MNLKVDLPEVIALSDKISQGQQMAESSLNVVKNEIGNLNAKESLKGNQQRYQNITFQNSTKQLFMAFSNCLSK